MMAPPRHGLLLVRPAQESDEQQNNHPREGRDQPGRRRSEKLQATQRNTASHPEDRERLPTAGPGHPVELIQSNQDRTHHQDKEVQGGSELDQQKKKPEGGRQR
ncbi:MAG: hypothetical protein M5R38_09570 [Candidatus Methylomirabilis sp.]|nr:hypothetical protein [Candidatus Methylomirabilis sp.]